jgi:hypothetical protein
LVCSREQPPSRHWSGLGPLRLMLAAIPSSSAGSFAEVKAGEVLTKRQRKRRNQKAAQAARGAASGAAGEGSGTAAMAIAAKETGPSPGEAVGGAADGRVPGPGAMAIAEKGSGARSDAGLASDSSGLLATSASACRVACGGRRSRTSC